MDEIIGAVLNHKKQGVTGSVYNQHKYDAEKQRAMLAWNRKIATIMSEEERDNIIPLRK